MKVKIGKIIQIAILPESDDHHMEVFALDDLGQIFRRTRNSDDWKYVALPSESNARHE